MPATILADSRVLTCTERLPEDKPRYVMGVGYPEDLLVSIALGADMFDCVWPTRTARFGNAITTSGVLNLRHSSYAHDFAAIDAFCRCPCCVKRDAGGLGISRSYIHHVANKETVGAHLLTMHNVHFQLDLMRQARDAIRADCFPDFLVQWLSRYLCIGQNPWPIWMVSALRQVGIELR